MKTPSVAKLRRGLAQLENINEQCCVPVFEEEDPHSGEEREVEDEAEADEDDDEDEYGNDDEIEIENMDYIPSEDNKVSSNSTDLCTPVTGMLFSMRLPCNINVGAVFDGDSQAQPIAKSARTAHRFMATSSAASGSSAPSARRNGRRSSAIGLGQKRSASPECLGESVLVS